MSIMKNKVHNGEVVALFERTHEKYSSLLNTVELDYAEISKLLVLILT
jgi:hypothetical protein